MTAILLQGGPAHGATVEVEGNCSLNVTGHGVPDGFVARYQPRDGRKRDNTVFRYTGMSQVLARLPCPRSEAA